jgi:tRNA G18 (ribose-2'-O)-methylase SpoU
MRLIAITNFDDPRIAVFRSLKATNQTRNLGQFVVEGEKLVKRLFASRFRPVSLLLSERHLMHLDADVPDDIPAFVVPHEMLSAIVGFPFHRGVLASAERQEWAPLRETIEGARGRVTLVVCPKLSDPENLGAIARISDVFGVDAILAGPSCPDPFSRRVLRVSMGSILRVPTYTSARLTDVVDGLIQNDQFVLIGAVADSAAEPFDQLSPPPRLGLVLGDEDQGIDPEWLARCAKIVTIPMRPGAGSVNVAVAAGILIQSLMR